MNNDYAWDKTIDIQDVEKKSVDEILKKRFGGHWLSLDNTLI
jgi:hypothetical protein